MLKAISLLILFAANGFAQQTTKDDTAQVWGLEKAYWEYVKANDLEKYRNLWHDRFLGWPSFNPAPTEKDHITDWMTANASKGTRLESYSIEQLGNRVTGDVAIVHYRVKMVWGTGQPADQKTDTLRITHTWVRTNGTWQILGGMSAPVNAEGK